MTKIRVGGVPEHFNMPWHLAIESNQFLAKELDVTWHTYKGGTGAMCKGLRDNEVDICVILTEGIIKDILAGNPSKIVSKYITTPLIWGVHTGVNNSTQYYGEIYDKSFAISRFGSGSHLMPQVDAMLKEKSLDESQFKIIKNLDGALESLAKNETDVFYWEKYTTKPYVDKGLLRCLGEFVTPWPCFVIAVREEFIRSNKKELSEFLNTIQFVCRQFVKNPNVINELSEAYNQKKEDIENWFHSTEWAQNSIVDEKMINNVLFSLKKAGLIDADQKAKFDNLVYQIGTT